MHDFRGFLIGGVKRAHTAQIAGREAIGCRIGRLQVFRRRDSRTFFRPAADHPTDLAVQFHLRELCRNSGVQRGKHGGVICGLADIHGLLLSGAVRLINAQSREKHGSVPVFFSASTYLRRSSRSAPRAGCACRRFSGCHDSDRTASSGILPFL